MIDNYAVFCVDLELFFVKLLLVKRKGEFK